MAGPSCRRRSAPYLPDRRSHNRTRAVCAHRTVPRSCLTAGTVGRRVGSGEDSVRTVQRDRGRQPRLQDLLACDDAFEQRDLRPRPVSTAFRAGSSGRQVRYKAPNTGPARSVSQTKRSPTRRIASKRQQARSTSSLPIGARRNRRRSGNLCAFDGYVRAVRVPWPRKNARA
jgi:hypothetical protein